MKIILIIYLASVIINLFMNSIYNDISVRDIFFPIRNTFIGIKYVLITLMSLILGFIAMPIIFIMAYLYNLIFKNNT